MVTSRVVGLAALLIAALGPGARAESPDPDPTKAVGKALGKGSFPWYDGAKDRARPIAAPMPREPLKPPQPPSGFWGWLRAMGNAITLVVFGLALAALIGLMIWFYRIYRPLESGDADGDSNRQGAPSRVDTLPEGLRREIESTDPWDEAIRRRDRGDLAGAVICLFAHQLLTLSRLGLVRLAKGRTGRQLLRSVVDPEFRALAQPTLRLFEAAYYGHRPPTPEEFARLWERAEAFERRVAGGVVA